MSTPTVERVEALTADLVPHFGDANTSMMLVRVTATKAEPQQNKDGLEVEGGIITAEILEVFHSSVLKRGGSVEIPFQRYADFAVRMRSRFDQWNVLPIQIGALWIVAARVISAPNVLMALAAIKVDTVNAPEVNATRQCYVIEKLKDTPEKKRALVDDALTRSEDVLRMYALDLLGRRDLFGRETGAQMIAKAITSSKTAPDDRVELGYYMTRQYFFDSDLKDDVANEQVVSALAMGLVTDSDHERRASWMNYLASCVLGEFSPKKDLDRAMRSALLKKIHTPKAAQVIEALNSLLPGAEADEKERIRELQAAWRAAL